MSRDESRVLETLMGSLQARVGHESGSSGAAAREDFPEAEALDRLVLYEQRMERDLFRAMQEIERVRLARGPARGAVSASA